MSLNNISLWISFHSVQEIKQHQDTIEANSSATIVDVHCQLADRSHEQLLGMYPRETSGILGTLPDFWNTPILGVEAFDVRMKKYSLNFVS